MNKPRILFFDIETSLVTATVWGTGKQYVGINQLLDQRLIICASWKWAGEQEVYNQDWGPSNHTKTKLKYERQLLTYLSEAFDESDIVVAHNGNSFDLPIIKARLAYHGLPPLPNHVIVEDTWQMARSLRWDSGKLDDLARKFGFAGKHTTSYSMWQTLYLDNAGNQDTLTRMVKYCDQDVRILEQVYNRLLPYLEPKVHRGLFSGVGVKDTCPSCGSDHVSQDPAGKYRYTKTGRYLRLVCDGCGKRFRSSRKV